MVKEQENVDIHLDVFMLFPFDDHLRFEMLSGVWSAKTSLLCIMGELAGGGSMAGAVDVTDR